LSLKLKEKKSLRRTRHRYEHSVKMELGEIRYQGMAGFN
jgi:hypothetical protein